jgi:hypothetical protein
MSLAVRAGSELVGLPLKPLVGAFRDVRMDSSLSTVDMAF